MDPVLRNVLITAAVIVIFAVIRRLASRYFTKKLTEFIVKNDSASFDEQIGKWYAKLFLSPFNMDYLKLNSYLIRGNDRLIKEMFERFDNVRLTDNQKRTVYTHAFSYFVDQDDKAKAKKYYELLMPLTHDVAVRKSISRLYDVYVEEGYKYLDETIAELDKADDAQKANLNSLISLMYKNKGDNKAAEKYYDAAQALISKLENGQK